MWWLMYRIKHRKKKFEKSLWKCGVLSQKKIDLLVSMGYRVRVCDWELPVPKDTVISWGYERDEPDVKWLYDSEECKPKNKDEKPPDITIKILGKTIRRINCNNCGAVLRNNKCEYCGTNWA